MDPLLKTWYVFVCTVNTFSKELAMVMTNGCERYNIVVLKIFIKI